IRAIRGSNRQWPSIHRVRSISECHGVISLRADGSGERTPEIPLLAQAADRGSKVVTRMPAKLDAGALVYVDTVERFSHRPASLRVLRLELRHISRHHCGSVDAKLLQIIPCERRRGGDNVTAESNAWRLLDCEQVRAHDVCDIAATI